MAKYPRLPQGEKPEVYQEQIENIEKEGGEIK
jgi:hypothetical protein